MVRDFAETEIAPHVARWDDEHTFPVDVVLKMGELGLFGLVFPEEWGGSGGDFASLCVAIEEIGRVDQSMGITLSAGVGLGANPIFQFGSDDQKQRWLPDLVAGRTLGAFGLTEPDGGSDAGATRTRAARRRRRMGDRRLEGVHHQLRHVDHVDHHRHGAHRRRRHLDVRRRGRHTGADRRAGRTASSAGTPATPTASSSTTAGSAPDQLLGAARLRASATS